MSKAGDIAKVSAKGGFHLLWGLVVSTVVLSIGTIFVARLLGSDLYGLYTVVLTVPSLISIFRDWGMNLAMVRFTAQYRSEGRINEIRSVYLTGIIFEMAIGLILSIFSFIFSDFIAAAFNRPAIASLIQIASFSIFASGIVSAATSAFTGYEKMEYNSIMLVFQSVSKTAVMILLVFLGFGAAGATIGYTTGIFVAGTVGLLLIWVIYRRLPTPSSNRLEIKAYLTTMLKYALPLSFATMISALLPQFYAFLLPLHYLVDNAAIGNYGVAVNFVVLITFFSLPVTTMMFPAFSKIDAQKDTSSLRNVFQFSVKYASLLILPVAAMVMCLAQPAVETLFGTAYDTAPLYLALLAIVYLFTASGTQSISGLLNGQGKTSYVLRMAILTGSIGFPLGYILIMNFGVLGLIATTITAGMPSFLLELRFVKKTFGATVDWISSAKILTSTAISAVTTYFIVLQLPFLSWLKLFIGVIIFLTIFFPALVVLKAIDQNDISNLRDMVPGIGPIGKVITLALNLLVKLINLFS